jgi:hypothetical protein
VYSMNPFFFFLRESPQPNHEPVYNHIILIPFTGTPPSISAFRYYYRGSPLEAVCAKECHNTSQAAYGTDAHTCTTWLPGIRSHASIGRLPYTSGVGESCYSRYGCGVSPRTSSSSRKRYGPSAHTQGMSAGRDCLLKLGIQYILSQG